MTNETIHYYFGFRNVSLETVAHSLAELLEIEWEHRDSAAYGDYYRFQDESRLYWLQENHPEFLSWVAPNYPRYHVILEVRGSDSRSIPPSTELQQDFTGVFDDVIFISSDDLGQLTFLKLMRSEPLGLLVYLVKFWRSLVGRAS